MIAAPAPLRFAVTDSSQVGEARRLAAGLAEAAELKPEDEGRLALVVTELGGNLIKHAGGGELLLRVVSDPPAVEVLALDSGVGMSDVGVCFRDGYSTAGSPGTGLGAVQRLASSMDIYSTRPGGTAIMARIAPSRRRDDEASNLEIGAVSVPKAGQEVCGDGWAADAGLESPSLMLVDGLGHGLGAANAARLARDTFAATSGQAPTERLDAIHGALRGSRGAAVAVARVDRTRGRVEFAGVGNIAGAIVTDGGARHLVSGNGTVGHDVRRINGFSYPWSDDALLVMHSDGLVSRWHLASYPGLLTRHPALIAAILYRDFNRGRDDVTVLVARRAPS